MVTTKLILDPAGDAVPADAFQPVSLSSSALLEIRELLARPDGDFARAVDLRVNTADLERARQASAAFGGVEVLGAAEFVVTTDDARQLPLSLEIECRATGPLRVTTYEDWVAKD